MFCRGAEKELHLRFLRTPVEVLPKAPASEEAGAVKLEVNQLHPLANGSQKALGTGEFETLPVCS